MLSKPLETLWTKAQAGALDRLEPAECLNQYAQIIQSNRRSVLVVANDDQFSSPADNKFIVGSRVYWATMFDAASVEGTGFAADAYHWICSMFNYDDKETSCSEMIDGIKSAPENWRVGRACGPSNLHCTVETWPVQYCLSETTEPHCKLHFEPTIAVIVTVLNFGTCLISSGFQLL